MRASPSIVTTRKTIARGDFAIFVVDAAVKSFIFALEAVLIGSAFLHAVVAAAGAGERSVEIGQQQDRQLRLQPSAHDFVQLEHNLAAKLSASTLIGFGGIRITVAEHHMARFKRRRDDLGNRLGAVGKHQSKLCACGEILCSRIEQKFANAVTDAVPPGCRVTVV